MYLLQLLRPFWPQILLAMGLSLPPALAQAWLPSGVVKPLFDQVLTGQFERLGPILWLAGGLLLLLVIGSYVQEAFMGYLSIKIPTLLRSRIFDRLLWANLASVPASSGGLSGRIVADLRELESFIFFSLGGLLVQGVTFIALLVQLLLRYTELTLYMLLALPLLALALAIVGRLVTRYSARAQAALERLASRMSEGFARLEFIRALGLESFARARFDQANQNQYRLARARALLSALNLPFGQLATTLLLGFLLALGVGQVQQGKMTAGDLTAFLTLLALTITPLQVLAKSGILYAQGEGAASRVHQLLDLPGVVSLGTLQPEHLEGRLEFREVSFAYGAGETLDHLNLVLSPGSFTALVGPSGSGKSTVLRLLLGLYPPSRGEVLLDGRKLEEYDANWLRGHLAWVPQEPLMFAGTVQENLQALAPHTSEARMSEVLSQIGLNSEISLSTRIEEDGLGLSVGQRQRLAIAAALLRDARIILFDEITSALDLASEAQVMAALEIARPGRTVVMVAHRLSTVCHADQILVLREGGLVEAGKHQELLDKNGLYADLWRR